MKSVPKSLARTMLRSTIVKQVCLLLGMVFFVLVTTKGTEDWLQARYFTQQFKSFGNDYAPQVEESKVSLSLNFTEAFLTSYSSETSMVPLTTSFALSAENSDFCRHTDQTVWWRNSVFDRKRLNSSKFFQYLEKDKDTISFKQSVCPVVVVGSDPVARKTIARFLKVISDIDILEAQSSLYGAAKEGLGKNSDGKLVHDKKISEEAEKLLPLSVAAKVLEEARSLDYDVEDVSEPLRSNIRRSIVKLKEMLEQKQVLSRRSLLVVSLSFDSAIYLMPFIEKYLTISNAVRDDRKEACKVSFVLGVQDSRNSAFQDIGKTIRQIGPELSSETAIDKMCLQRVRSVISQTGSNLTPKSKPALFNPLLTEEIRQLELLEFEQSISTLPSQSVPCTIKEIPILRNAQVWATSNAAAIKFLSKTGRKGFILRVEDIVLKRNRNIANLLNRLGGFCSRQRVSSKPFVMLRKGLKLFTMPYTGKIIKSAIDEFFGREHLGKRVSLWQQDPRTHNGLVEQVLKVAGASLLVKLGYAAPSPNNPSQIVLQGPSYSTKQPGTKQRVDAGSCWQDVTKPLQDYQKDSLTFSVGHCLPTFIVVGVQKGGTDELAVWLNFNVYHRRLDGGVELHFFDCVGRSNGGNRTMCSRYRDSSMTWDSKAADEKKKKDKFTWKAIKSESPFLDDTAWENYAKLGHLRHLDFHRRKTLTFEKSPSYFDLANPFDVSRLLPSVKLIMLLREPVSRLYSGYWHSCSGKLSERQNCNLANFTANVDILLQKGIEKVQDTSFKRAVEVGKYERHMQRWRSAFADNQILVTFAEHFKNHPQAVVYFIEDFVGNTGKRHHVYTPHVSNGYYVLGYYSKAGKPSHKVELPKETRKKLEAYYAPWNTRLRRLLLESNLVYKPPSSIPSQYLDGDKLELPKWLK